MPGEWFEKGLKARREVVGPEYVERAFKESEVEHAAGFALEARADPQPSPDVPGHQLLHRQAERLGFLEGALHVFGADHFSPRLESLLEPFAGHLRLLSVLAKRGEYT